MAGHPLRSATDRRLGGPLPHQLPNQTRVHLIPPEFLPLYHAVLWSYAVLAAISNCYPPVWGRLPTRYSPVRRSVTKVFIRRIKLKRFARLACVKHAASVHPEPGSNSRLKILIPIWLGFKIKVRSRSRKLLAFLSLLLFKGWHCHSMSVLNFLLKNLQGCCLLFNYQGSFSLLSSQRQLIYIITFTIACQQLFYFSFSLSASIISVVRNSLSRISFLSTFVNRKFHLFFCVPMSS